MAQQILTLETLHKFDFGKAAMAWQTALAQAVRDITDRPGDQTARKVILTATLKPTLQQDGDVVDAAVDFQIQTKLPAYQTASRPAGVTRNGQLYFQEHAPDNPDQTTFEPLDDNEP